MGTNINKAARQDANRKILDALALHLPDSVMLGGVSYTPAKLAEVFQNSIEIADAADKAAEAWHAAVAAERRNTEQVSTVRTLLRSYARATFGEATTEYADFGFAPKVVTEMDAEAQDAAVAQSAATRVARAEPWAGDRRRRSTGPRWPPPRRRIRPSSRRRTTHEQPLSTPRNPTLSNFLRKSTAAFRRNAFLKTNLSRRSRFWRPPSPTRKGGER